MRKSKFRILFILLFMSVFVLQTQSANYFGIHVYIDDSKIDFNDNYGKPFINGDNRTLIPFRRVLEKAGAEVSWDQSTKTAVAVKGNITIKVPIGKKYIIKNGKKAKIDTKAILYNDRTYIPLRAVMEGLGADVKWEGASKTVHIQTRKRNTQISKLPKRYDLRNIRRSTPVKDQGNIGACWAFASIGAIETVVSQNRAVDLSEDHLSLTHGYNLKQNEGGDINISLAYFARWSGPVLEKDDKYGDSHYSGNAKPVYHVQECRQLPEKDYSAIKRAIMAYGGVQSSIHIENVENRKLGNSYNEKTHSYYYNGTKKPNHDILIVGWDDYYSKDNFKKKPRRNGAFICKNSYGKAFGDDGYFYISYSDVRIGTNNLVFTRVDNKDNYDKIYQSDWLGHVGSVGYNNERAFFANVFKPKGREYLKAVSFYALGRDTSYSIYLVKNFRNEKDFARKIFLKNGRFDYKGYYTVDLNEAIKVDKDFAVVVKITTPDAKYPVAAEFVPSQSWLKDVDISDGRGYMSSGGKVWNSTEKDLKANVCLKAFTDVK